jgi:hypothetical protein
MQQVSKQTAENFATAHKIEFIESSAKTNIGVQESFYRLTRNVVSKVISGDIVLSGNPKIIQKEEKKKGLCCG